MEETLKFITDRIAAFSLEHTIHSFDSGAKMIDVRINSEFYCIQLFKDEIGMSLLSENTGFDTIPDSNFKTQKEFEIKFEDILSTIKH